MVARGPMRRRRPDARRAIRSAGVTCAPCGRYPALMCDNCREVSAAKAQGFGTPPVVPARDEGAASPAPGRREIRPVGAGEFDEILAIINEAAQVYRGVIPEDRWHDPYFSADYLRSEMGSGVRFFGYEVDGELLGVMGVQDVDDVTLIRHAYVRPGVQRGGVGGRLLSSLLAKATAPVLIGTWADASWAIAFYEKNGFAVVSPEEKTRLLRRYWDIPGRQVETSVVLAQR
jgi:GNAT superfamily N-acetyltransferase